MLNRKGVRGQKEFFDCIELLRSWLVKVGVQTIEIFIRESGEVFDAHMNFNPRVCWGSSYSLSTVLMASSSKQLSQCYKPQIRIVYWEIQYKDENKSWTVAIRPRRWMAAKYFPATIEYRHKDDPRIISHLKCRVGQLPFNKLLNRSLQKQNTPK